MKVVQVVSYVSVECSGPSYSVPGLCRGLASSGVEVELYTREPLPERVLGCRTSAYRRGRWGEFWERSPALERGLRLACQQVDIVQANGMWMLPHLYPSWAVRGTKCKLVTAPRGMLAPWALKHHKFRKMLFGLLGGQYNALKMTDMFHATSEKEYEEIRALGYKQPVAIVPIGMDIPDVSQFVSNSNTLNSKTQTLRQVAFFGRLHKVKAVDRLVQAWEIVNGERGRVEEWELVIAGPDCGVRSELESYIADHQIPRVRFVGEINGPAKYEFLSSADLYVLPSHTENFGVTVAEALACGTPVVVSKGTPWRGVEGEKGERGVRGGEKKARGRCGWWVDNTPESLASAIREAISLSLTPPPSTLSQHTHLSPLTLFQMGEAGREWILRDFSWGGVGAKMKKAYEWLLDPMHVEKPEWVRVV